MIRPEWEFAPLVSGILLVLLIGGLAWRAVRRDRREYPRFKRTRSTRKRQATYRRWLIGSFLSFGGSAAVVLALVGQNVDLMRRQVESWDWVESLRSTIGPVGGAALAVIIVVLLVASVVALFAARTALTEEGDEVPALGDIQSLLPRNRAELRYGALLSLNAGVVEELLFRLAVPALVFGITGDAAVAFVGALILFGLLHLYQGAAGVIGATVIGALLTLVYLASGSILWAIALHAFIDLRSLVLIPVVVLRVHRRPGDYSRPPTRRVRKADAAAPAAVAPGDGADVAADSADSAPESPAPANVAPRDPLPPL